MRRNARIFIVLTLAGTICPAHAETTTAGADSRREGRREEAPQEVSDRTIRRTLEEKLERLDGVDGSTLQVEVKDQVATISGTVRNLIESERIVEAASGVRGVADVVTRLAVEGPRRADRDVAQDVREALRADPVTADAEIESAVENGIVTLRGRASIWPEQQLAGWIASDVDGVREVRNNITVEGAQRSDLDIAEAIKQRFETDPLVNDEIGVVVAEGRATLSGAVGSALERRWAIADAYTLGVQEVDASALRVDADAAPTDRRARRASDAEIREALKNALLYDPRVYSFTPDIAVEGGVVTLTGSVSNLKARQAAVQIASTTSGVQEVRDHLTVQAETRGDEEIAAELRRRIERSATVEAPELDVEVEDGRVILSGRVDTGFERWAAGDLAARTRGVSEVDNRIAVAGASGPVAAGTDTFYYPWHSSYAPWVYSADGRQKSDAELRASVRNQLFWSPFTDEAGIRVTVKNGVVTLTGEVDSRLEKGVAAETAYDAGAKGVENRLVVVADSRER